MWTMLHHTVRTRTRFFTKKGSGTFLFIGGLRQQQNGKQAKAGDHHGDGTLPFDIMVYSVSFSRSKVILGFPGG